MSGISSRVVTALRNLNRYGTKWMRTQAPHWTTADSLALVLDRHQTMCDKYNDPKSMFYNPKLPEDHTCHCAQEGWVQTDTSPDIWAEDVLYGEREEWPPYDIKDEVESPSHYTIGEREAIDYMREMGVLEDYAAGNIFKYLYRYKYKDNPTGDLLKARRYIDILIEELNDD